MTIRGFARGRSVARGFSVALSSDNLAHVRQRVGRATVLAGALAGALAQVCAVAGALITPVAAADLGAGGGNPPDYVAEEFSWTGLYFGGHAGYATGDWNGPLFYDDWVAGADYWGGPFDFSDQNIGGEGWFGGFQAGANKQFGLVVVGLEADVSWTGFDGEGTLEPYPDTPAPDWLIENKVDTFGTVRGRAGVTPTERLLLYGTGGFAWAKVTSNIMPVWPDGRDAAHASAQNNHIGWAAGAGGEYALTDNLTVKFEYLYVNLDEQDYAYSGETPTGAVYATDHFNPSLDFHSVTVGINYLFN